MKLITVISTGTFILFSAGFMKKNMSVQKPSLFEKKWTLKKIHTVDGMQAIQTNAFIKFDQDKKCADGNAGCNSFGSNFSVNSKSIIFKNIFSTKMYCEDLQQTENEYLKQLAEVNWYKETEKSLQLYRDKEVLLEFELE